MKVKEKEKQPAPVLELTESEKQALVASARHAAIAIAEFWDTLRTIEVAHDVMLEYTEAIETLAADCSHPPTDSLRELTAAQVLEMLEVSNA